MRTYIHRHTYIGIHVCIYICICMHVRMYVYACSLCLLFVWGFSLGPGPARPHVSHPSGSAPPLFFPSFSVFFFFFVFFFFLSPQSFNMEKTGMDGEEKEEGERLLAFFQMSLFNILFVKRIFTPTTSRRRLFCEYILKTSRCEASTSLCLFSLSLRRKGRKTGRTLFSQCGGKREEKFGREEETQHTAVVTILVGAERRYFCLVSRTRETYRSGRHIDIHVYTSIHTCVLTATAGLGYTSIYLRWRQTPSVH